MHLWTEYEGVTLNSYPLGRLYRSEGRSAFFLTTTPQGPAMLRLTESHFDDAELVGRWKTVAAVHHPHLQTIEHFGRTTYDQVSLAFCLLQLNDSSLSDVLADRPLSTEETQEVAEAIAGALAALHAASLVHEHVDASNVFAMGETIKLRSDCARECVGDFEADTSGARDSLRQRDVRDLGLLLLRCLGLEQQSATPKALPGPFNRIIPGTLNGTLSAAGILAVLNPPAAVTAQATSGSPEKPVYANMPQPVATAAPVVAPQRAAKPISSDPFDVGLGSLRNELRQDTGLQVAGAGFLHRLVPRAASSKVWIATGTAAAIIVLVLWNPTGRTKHSTADAPRVVVAESTTTRPESAPALVRGVPHAKPSAMTEMRPAQRSLLTSGVQAGWHVIAYTYNYEQQAQAKAEHLKRDYKALQPQVFTPTGHAPYFVALGGSSDAASALSLRDRARRVGLPRDTYARNF